MKNKGSVHRDTGQLSIKAGWCPEQVKQACTCVHTNTHTHTLQTVSMERKVGCRWGNITLRTFIRGDIYRGSRHKDSSRGKRKTYSSTVQGRRSLSVWLQPYPACISSRLAFVNIINRWFLSQIPNCLHTHAHTLANTHKYTRVNQRWEWAKRHSQLNRQSQR